jgi:hypothetical protein
MLLAAPALLLDQGAAAGHFGTKCYVHKNSIRAKIPTI